MRRAYGYTLVVVVAWGISLPTTKALLTAERGGERLTPAEVAFWAIGCGWLALLVALAARGRLGRLRGVTWRGWVVLGAMGFFGWAGYAVALNYAFVQLPMPDAVVINYLHPVFVVVLQGAAFGAVARRVSGWEKAPLVRGRPGPVRMAAGLLLCLAGVAMIATEGRVRELGGIWRGGSGAAAGALAALFAAFSWGVYSNLARFVKAGRGEGERGTGDVQTWAAMTFGVVMMAAGLLVKGQLKTPTGFSASLRVLGAQGPEIGAWWLIAFMGVVVYCLGYTLWLLALELGEGEGGAHKLPPLTYLTPVIAMVLGWAALGERFGPGFWEGAGLVAAGNAVNLWRGRRGAG